MVLEYGVVIAAILGLHFVAGYCHRREYPVSKGFIIGSCYAVSCVFLFLLVGIVATGVEATTDRMTKIGPILGLSAYIFVSGAYAAWPSSGST